MSNSFRLHGLQPTRLPCLLQCPGACSDSWPLSWWCYLTISSSVIPFSPCPQSFPASGSFPMCELFASGGQSTGVSASVSIISVNIQDWFPLGLTSWISLWYKGLSRGLLQNHNSPVYMLLNLCFILSCLSVSSQFNFKTSQKNLEEQRKILSFLTTEKRSINQKRKKDTSIKKIGDVTLRHTNGLDCVVEQ